MAKTEPSLAARREAARKRTDPAEGEPLPVHSFHTLLGDLATLTRNVVRLGRDHLTGRPRHPHPGTTSRPRSARPHPHRVDRPTRLLQAISMACDRKRAKFILAVLSLSITAETEDCVMMTIKHDDLAIAVVQFHPRSVMTSQSETGMPIITSALSVLGLRPA